MCLDALVEAISPAETSYVTPCPVDTADKLKYKYNRNVFWNILTALRSQINVKVPSPVLRVIPSSPHAVPVSVATVSEQCAFDLI